MKKLAALLLALASTSTALADEDWPTVYGNADLVVKSIGFHKKSDEFGTSFYQMVSIIVQNIGQQYVHSPSGKVRMKGVEYSASVYGPSNVAGQYLLGARIYPGQQGQLLLYIPDGTLRHCERINGVIDSSHRLQYGYGNPFANDALGGVMAKDSLANRPCVLDPISRRPNLPRLQDEIEPAH